MTRTLNCWEESDLVPPPGADLRDGFGALETPRGVLPLVALDVHARINGLVAHTTVRQVFRNSLEEPLEATYIFPLPDRAAVRSFRMEVADRVIEAELKERQEAREEYQKAIDAGHRAAIAEEDRSDVFSIRVGNIPAHETITVELTLVGPLPVAGGEATFRFPLVVAPRYVPGIPLDGSPVGPGWAEDTDQVPDASRVTPPILLPGFPNPVRLSLVVEIDPAGLCPASEDWTAHFRSSLHSVILGERPPWTVRLQPGERLNRDFVLRFPVAAATFKTALVCSPVQADQPGTMLLTLVPPALTEQNRPSPRDLVILLDRSGSMGGWKIVAARRAVGRIVDSLLEQDRFTVLAFDSVLEFLPGTSERLVEATDRHRWQALGWLGSLEARGGTEMGPALQTAARLLADADAPRQRIVVLVTDGQVAGEDVLLKQMARHAGGAMPRIHTLGIDRAVNAGFLRRLADLGGGTFDLVESEDRLETAMDTMHRAMGKPVLTQLRLQPRGFQWLPDSLVPARLPDVFADRPLMILGRFRGEVSSAGMRVEGIDVTGKPWCEDVMVQACRPGDDLASLWGRATVRQLEDDYAAGKADSPETLARQIVRVSLESHVLSRFTAYVAVDRSEVVNADGKPHEIVQPVEMPAAWELKALMPMQTRGCFAAESLACALPQLLIDASPASLPLKGLGKLCRSLVGNQEASPRSVGELVAALRTCIEEMKKSLDLSKRKQVRMWKQLVELLGQLTVALMAAGRTAPNPFAEGLEESCRILKEFRRWNSPGVPAEETDECLELLTNALDLLDPLPKQDSGKQKFWT